MTDAHATTSDAEAEAVAAAGHPPTAQRSTASWTLLLTGPAVWFAHFGIVYLLAEAACEFTWLDGELAGLRTLSVIILALTGVFILPVLASTVIAWQRWRRPPVASSSDPSPAEGRDAHGRPVRSAGPGDAGQGRDRSLAFIGMVLGLLFVASILAVGLPALVLEPC